MLAKVTLEGRFVRLVPLSRAHTGPLRSIVEKWPREAYPYAMVPSRDQLEPYVAKALAAMDAGQALTFAITLVETDEVVGSTRFFDLQSWEWPKGLDPRPTHRGFDACEIGYTWLAPQAQRTATNTEAKLLMLGHAFDAWGCERVQLKTDLRNDRSRRAIERLGAKFEGVLRANQPAADGTPRDSAYYSVLRPEWPAVKRALSARLGR